MAGKSAALTMATTPWRLALSLVSSSGAIRPGPISAATGVSPVLGWGRERLNEVAQPGAVVQTE
jgi:hypothetical protein